MARGRCSAMPRISSSNIRAVPPDHGDVCDNVGAVQLDAASLVQQYQGLAIVALLTKQNSRSPAPAPLWGAHSSHAALSRCRQGTRSSTGCPLSWPDSTKQNSRSPAPAWHWGAPSSHVAPSGRRQGARFHLVVQFTARLHKAEQPLSCTVSVPPRDAIFTWLPSPHQPAPEAVARFHLARKVN